MLIDCVPSVSIRNRHGTPSPRPVGLHPRRRYPEGQVKQSAAVRSARASPLLIRMDPFISRAALSAWYSADRAFEGRAVFGLDNLEAIQDAGNARPVGVFALRKTRHAFIAAPGAAQIFVPPLVHIVTPHRPGLRNLLRYPRRALIKTDRVGTNYRPLRAGLKQGIR
jgi:hypothetical protein